MNILELFAGSRSFGKEAELLNHNVFSIDWKNYEGINLSMDIESLLPSHIPFTPDVVWASPDCTTYSISAISHHRNGIEPKSDYAKKCDRVNKHVLELIFHFKSLNPNLIYFIENPRGMMRKMPFMLDIPRHTVTYCQYGDTRMKPTDIFTNSKTWVPKSMCKNGSSCHEAAPRGSKTGTQGKKDSYNRSKIPAELCREILLSF